MASSIYPLSLSLSITGAVTAAALVSGGTGYNDTTESVTLTGQTSGATGATATVTVSSGIITSIDSIDIAGTGYINDETLTLTGVTSGASNATATATTAVIAAASDILSSDLSITTDQMRPGGGGIVRLAFGFSFGTTPATISVFNNGAFKGNLNADNSTNIITNGYYRFDIDVEAGDSINLQSSQIVDGILFLRAHLVVFGT